MSVFKLQNVIQDYAWGSEDYISDLLGLPIIPGQSKAELWMGVHPKAPSRISSEDCTLLELINNNATAMLGEKVITDFSRKLPFLLKVLSAATPLSIQAHPNLEQAEKGFALENKLEIPLFALHRNYKDDNHKPELICALTPFTVMCGFRSSRKIREFLDSFGMHSILPDYDDIEIGESQLKRFFSKLMNTEKKLIANWVNILLININDIEITSENKLIIKWIKRLNKFYPGDVGVFAPILLNLIELLPGQAVYLDAGILHAYLEGSGIEIMANSDNVLRGGLTPKHIDVSELLKTLIFRSGQMELTEPFNFNNNEYIYETPATEFELSRIELFNKLTFDIISIGPEILLCTKGALELTCESTKMSINKGESIFVSAKCRQYSLLGNGQLFRAIIPLNKE